MSCWLCGNKTLSLAVDVIKTDEFKEKYDKDGSSDKSHEELMGLLASLNSDSLNCRYGFDEDNYLDEVKYIPQDVSDAQRHKSVGCYLYQTSESMFKDECPVFEALDQWAEDNYEKYNGEERDNCHWDIDNPL